MTRNCSCFTREEAEALAKRLKLRFYRTSVKENLNVEEVFRYLTEKYIERNSVVSEDNATTSAKIGENSQVEMVMTDRVLHYDLFLCS